ncbi:MAG: exonuclease domain-containing protein, partial [Brachybacterium sp.]
MIERTSVTVPEGAPVGLLDHLLRRTPSTAEADSPTSPAVPRFAVVDVETTGLDPDRHRILELAILRADEHGRVIDQWTARFHPDGPVGATHIHGITDADVANAPRFRDLAITVGTALQDLVVVAHNAEFDIGFLRAEFTRAGLPMPRFTTYCTLQGSTLYLPQLQRRRLPDCCAALGVTLQGAHSALGDAFATADLLAQYLALDARTGYDAPLTATRALHAGALAGPGHPVAQPPAPAGPPDPQDSVPAAHDAADAVDISPTAVRAWARAQGIPVGDRGRLSAALVAQYREAMRGEALSSAGSPKTVVATAPDPVTAPVEAPAAPPAEPAPSMAPAPSITPAPSAAPLTITEDFQAALDHLHAGHHLFLTGKAGTGKSTLIRHYLESTARRTITVAPTGIAALNVDGYTIHRLFSFPIGVSEEMVRGGGYYPGRFAKALKELDTLIVDEASMVRADLFDALTAALERFGPRPGEPFGGVQLVLVGDLYQLPPVVTDHEAAWIEERFGTPFFFSARSFDAATFPVVELSTVFRQQGDDRLVDLLNAVREGTLLEEARAELNQRTAADFEPDLDEFWLTLATTNRIVGAR